MAMKKFEVEVAVDVTCFAKVRVKAPNADAALEKAWKKAKKIAPKTVTFTKRSAAKFVRPYGHAHLGDIYRDDRVYHNGKRCELDPEAH